MWRDYFLYNVKRHIFGMRCFKGNFRGIIKILGGKKAKLVPEVFSFSFFFWNLSDVRIRLRVSLKRSINSYQPTCL